MRKTMIIGMLGLLKIAAFAQCPTNLNLQKQWEIPFVFAKQAMTVEHDQNGKDYIYVAAKEQGVLIYNVSGTTPVQSKQFAVNSLENLEPMSLSQHGNYVYVALGNTFGSTTDVPGMAIIDVSDPANAVLKDTWKFSSPGNGAGIVKVEGNYAYLGAMGKGLIILDISDKSNISFVSQFVLNNSFPNPVNPDPAKYNARGMVVRNDLVYLCYDAGGLRIIDVSNKTTPKECGHYANTALMNRPRAYNNIILDDSLAYVAIDYCGMEVLNIKDTANIKQIGWWNPWRCESTSNTWFNSGGHTNEIAFDKECKLVFMSSGKSEINVVSVSNPSTPDSCTKYTTNGSNQGAWGLGLYQNQIYAAYIFVPLGIPFFSSWGGVKKITWTRSCTNPVVEPENVTVTERIRISPNPGSGNFNILSPNLQIQSIAIYDGIGKRVYHQEVNEYEFQIEAKELSPGCYMMMMMTNKGFTTQRLIIEK